MSQLRIRPSYPSLWQFVRVRVHPSPDEDTVCGIAGIYDKAPMRPQAASLAAMLYVERHRGPEVAGIYRSEHIALGHDRLSIIDLAGGLQPIANEDGSVWIVCNG